MGAINGSIVITNQYDMAISMINSNTKILLLCDFTDINIENNPDIISGACLLPPPIAKIAEIDGDANKFFGMYTEYLLSDIPVDFIAIIISYLFKGGNFIIFTQSSITDAWIQVFRNHFINFYGIIIGDEMHPPGYNNAFNNSNANILLETGNMSAEEYLKIYDISISEIPALQMQEISRELGFSDPNTMEEANSIIQSVNNLNIQIRNGCVIPVRFAR